MTIKKDMPEIDDRWRRKGGAHKCNIPLPEVCPDCGGTGLYITENGEYHECPRCEGTGEVWE